MADNTTLSTGTGGDVIATDDITGVKFQRVKLVEGADGVNDGDISAANPLPVQISDGTDVALVSAGGALLVDGSAVTQPVSNTVLSVVGGGVEASAQRVTIASDSTGVLSVDDNGGNLSIDWAGTVPPIGAGTEAAALRVTVATDSTGVLSIDDNGGSLTIDGNIGVLPITAGGCLIYHTVSAASTNAVNIKASAGQVYGWNIFSLRGTPLYVKFHNTAGAPTAGTGVVHTIGVQAGTARELSVTTGLQFTTGIGITIVTGITDADATAVAANDCVVDIYYK